MSTDLNSERSKTWKSSFGTSMSAISFGFVATAILISMFLIMAIFEHLFKQSATSESTLASYQQQQQETRKEVSPQSIASTSYACDLSVMMPGQQYPTYIAQPAPLSSPREGAYWPSHQHQHQHQLPHFIS